MKSFTVQVPEYEGPFDLLLSIVRQNKLSLTDLPLAPIAAQYLAYVREAEALDVNLSMEWIDIAARLIHWKASSLLPVDPILPDQSASLAQELSRELKTFSDSQLNQAKELLWVRSEEQEQCWTKASDESIQKSLFIEEELSASLWSIRRKAQALHDIFQKRRHLDRAILEMHADAVSVEEMRMAALLELEPVERGVWFSAAAWFISANTLERKICLFLALLDLAADGVIRIGEEARDCSIQLCRL